MTDVELKFIKSSRKFYRSKVTRKCNQVEQNLDNFTFDDKNVYLEEFKDLKLKLKKFNCDVAEVFWKITHTEEELERELESCDEYEQKCNQAIRRIEVTMVPVIPPPRTDGFPFGDSDHRVSNSNNLKLPVLPLPEFSNKKDEIYDKFIKSFEAMMGKYNLNPIEKFLYLEKQLKGEPLTLIKSLSFEDQSYDSAKTLLDRAFSSPVNQKFDLIKRMTELRLSYPGEPYSFISEFRTIRDMIKSLELDIDTVLQYFLLSGMNDRFKTLLINISGSNKPSLAHFEENMFSVTERYLQEVKIRPGGGNNSVVGLATNVNYSPIREGSRFKFKLCTLCESSGNSVDHPIFKCPRFPSAESRINKLRSIGACIKCANNNHKTNECKYKFKRLCSKCGKPHFDFLCFSQSRDIKSDSSTSTGMVTINAATLKFEDSKHALLPTFVFSTSSGRILRGMKDSGSQCNFILDSVAKEEKFTIVERNIELCVSGFNSSHKFLTNVVKIRGRFGPNEHDVLAICVPKISTSLCLPGLSEIVFEFKQRGLQLADSFLNNGSEVIENLDFILGSLSDHCVPVETKCFGRDFKSSYLASPLGVLLLGSINLLKINLPFLNDSLCYRDSPNNMSDTSLSMDFGSLHDPGTGYGNFSFEMNHVILDDNFKLRKDVLTEATFECIETETKPNLERKCQEILDLETCLDEEVSTLDNEFVNHVLDSTKRAENGRLIMPLPWDSRVSHLMGNNFALSRQILYSNLRKLKKDGTRLEMVDNVVKEQRKMGVIEEINDLDGFRDSHPESCFLAHMPIFKENRETTKCRLVFLSNLVGKEKAKTTLSNNQCMLAGPCINSKLSTGIINLRFDKFVLCFDIVKAFLSIGLNEKDCNKLCFLWFRNPTKGDFTLVGYRNTKLSFGLKCSPTLLMLALYKILILDVSDDSQELIDFKKQLFHNFYMDNGAFTCNSREKLQWAYNNIAKIFSPYQFFLQQFCTNDPSLQKTIDIDSESESGTKVKLLGLEWDKSLDTISTVKLDLDAKADSKRKVLKTIASNFDVYNFNGPLLNRARLFLHKLQCDGSIGWDCQLSKEHLRTWHNITKQFNSSPDVSIDRFVGDRRDEYYLIAFSDSSKLICGVVIYIYNLNTKKVNFLLAKNRLIGRKLEDKSIPSLEFHALSFGTEVLIDTFKELAGDSCVIPVNVRRCLLYTDSLVCLNWLTAFANRFEKMKHGVFISNRLLSINKKCEIFPVEYRFCSGSVNPADCMTRELSFKQLEKSTFLTGPELLNSCEETVDHSVTLPNPITNMPGDHYLSCNVNNTRVESCDEFLNASRFSSLSKLLAVTRYVLLFVNKLKLKLKSRDSIRFSHLQLVDDNDDDAFRLVIKTEQHRLFHNELVYLHKSSGKIKNEIPDNIARFNLFEDEFGILRVKSKFGRYKNDKVHPIFLSSESALAHLLVMHYHTKLNHNGLYPVLNAIRKQFWIAKAFSLVKKIISRCVICRRVNRKSVKLNQSAYRDFRAEPPCIPFRAMFLDYIGPFSVMDEKGERTKVYILCFTCLWSRATNLKLCDDLSVDNFLRAFMLHTMEYGIPEMCHSDMGSQIVSGSNIISNFLADEKSLNYFREQGLQPLRFQQFPKGCKQLGGIVEVCVKHVKRLLNGAIGRNVLVKRDFDFLVHQTVNLINKRPVVFKEVLRDDDPNNDYTVITPEQIVKGYELPNFNIIPDLQVVDMDSDWYQSLDNPNQVKIKFGKLAKTRNRLIDLYNSEFLPGLISQAVDRRGRFKQVKHDRLNPGDLVLITEENTKRFNYPLGRIIDQELNYLGEVTEVRVMKGSTKEILRRHPSSVIPILTSVDDSNLEFVSPDNSNSADAEDHGMLSVRDRSHLGRLEATKGSQRTRNLMEQGLA